MNKVIIIGDSHVNLFSHDAQYNRGTWSDNSLDFFETKWLGPITMHRVCRDGLYDMFKGINVKTNHHYILSIGEIDVRSHIIKQALIQNKSKYDIIDDLVVGFKKRLIEFNYYNYRIHVLSIMPPIQKDLAIAANEEFPFIGTDEERRFCTLYLNENLLKLSRELEFGYFNHFNLYKDDNDFLDINKSDKIVHAVKTLEFEEYTRKYFNI